MSVSLIPSLVSLTESPFPPVAVGGGRVVVPACRSAAMVTKLTTTTDTSITAAVAFQGERLEVFPGELLVGERRTTSSGGAARWPA